MGTSVALLAVFIGLIILGMGAMPLLPFMLLQGIGLGVGYIGYRIYERFKWSPPLWVGPLYGVLAFLLVLGLVSLWDRFIGLGMWSRDPFMVVLAPSTLAIYIAGRMFAASVGGHISESVYQVRFPYRFPREYGKALRFVAKDDVEGAIEAYRAYYREASDDVDPLFHAADLAEEHGMLDVADGLYDDVLQLFASNTEVCTEARLRQEALERMRDRMTATR